MLYIKLIRRFIKSILKYFKRSDFIKPFIATILGVMIAFYLNDYRHSFYSNKVTTERIHILYLEMQYNSELVNEALKAYSKQIIKEIFIRRASYPSAISAVNDPNIVSFLPRHKLSLLLNYIESMRTLNLSLNMHQEFSFNTNTKSFKDSNDMMEAIRSNAATALASCYLIQRELEEYFDKNSYDDEKLNSLRKEMQEIQKQYLKHGGIKN